LYLKSIISYFSRFSALHNSPLLGCCVVARALLCGC